MHVWGSFAQASFSPQDILAGNSRSQRTGYPLDFTMNESVRLQLT